MTNLGDWDSAIAGFERNRASTGTATTTTEVQTKRLRRLAQSMGGSPWDINREQLQRWLDALPGDRSSVSASRQAIRAFYRWAFVAGFVAESPAPEPPPTTRYKLDARWRDALSLFETAQGADKITSAVVVIRVKHMTRFATDAAVGPWQTQPEGIQDWLTALACGEGTRLQYRDSLRAFYRWAKSSGRVVEDPTLSPSLRAKALPVPPLWAGELRLYRSYLRAIGRPETTIGKRLEQLARFARDHASLAPFEVTLDDLIDWMSGKRWATETRRGHGSTFKSFYGWADDTGRIDANPTAHLPIVKAAQPRPRPALESDYAAALGRAQEREALALRLAAELGMRRAEVAVVHSRDIVGQQGAWSLVVHGKGDKLRTLPLPRGLASQLQSLPAGYAFPGQVNGHMSPRWLGKRISALLPVGVTMHALRHRFATNAYNIDRDIFTVQQMLGHSSPATTQRYVQVSDASMRRLIDTLSR